MHRCAKCPSPVLNGIRIILVGSLVAGWVLAMVVMNLKSKQDATTFSIVSRILTNYIQCQTASFSFKLQFPTSFKDLFSLVQEIGESSLSMLSFECFIDDVKINVFGQSTFIFKAFLSCILPIILFFGLMAIWIILKFIRKKKMHFFRYFTTTLITVIYFFYSQLTEVSLSFFKCFTLDDKLLLLGDLEVQCWEGAHAKWTVFFWGPLFLVWVVGLPLFGIVFLILNRTKIETPSFDEKYMVLYPGMKKNRAFWEMANILRKIILLSINVFLPEDLNLLKATFAVVFLLCYKRV